MKKPTNEYWRQRFIQLEEALHNKSTAYFHDLENEYRKAQDSIERDLAKWYMRLADNNGITLQEARKLLDRNELKEFRWTVEEYIKYGKENAVDQRWLKELENASARVHISRLDAMKVQIQNQIENLMGTEVDGVSRLMEEMYTEGYYRTAFEIQHGYGVGSSFMRIDPKTVERVLSKPWTADGTNFSERIWGKHRPQLVNELHTQLTQAYIRGDNPQKCVGAIAKRFGVAKSRAENLVMSEAAFFRGAGQIDSLKNLGTEEYENCATLDSRTTQICRDMDGTHFKLSEYKPGITASPFHNRCRTVMAPYFNDEFTAGEMRVARDSDGKTYYVPADMKYPDWKKKFVDKPLTAQGIRGTIKAVNGIVVQTYSGHSLERLIDRNVEASAIENALKDPLYIRDVRYDSQGRPSQRFIGEDATVNINPDTGVITTVWKTGKDAKKRYKKGGE